MLQNIRCNPTASPGRSNWSISLKARSLLPVCPEMLQAPDAQELRHSRASTEAQKIQLQLLHLPKVLHVNKGTSGIF